MDRWRDAGLLIVCLGALGGVLHAGLRPYDFFVPNGASWSGDAGGLQFNGSGIAATAEGFDAFASSGVANIGVEVWLRRTASPPADGGVVLALGDGGGKLPLLLAQWQSSFYVRFPALRSGTFVEHTLPVGDDFPEGEQRFVAFSSGAAGSRVYLDSEPVGESAARFDPGPLKGAVLGHLVLGSRLQAARGWVGRIDGLAVYGRALTQAEIARHGVQVLRGGPAAISAEPGLVALYAFDERSGDRARDLLDGGRDLVIPRRYRPLESGWLQLHPAIAGRAVTVTDAVVNFLGFIPVGFLIALALRRRGEVRGGALFWSATVLGFSLSLMLETVQTVLPSRVSSADDLALNSSGTALGALVAMAWGALRRRFARV